MRSSITLSRRDLLASAAALAFARPAVSAPTPNPFGVVLYSYGAHTARERGLGQPLRFLQFCRERGAGGVQTSIPRSASEDLPKIRRLLDESGMWLEGVVSLPRDAADVERFAADLRAAREAGAVTVRTTLIGSRRYEAFSSAEEYAQAKARGRKSLELAVPAAERSKVRLAIENHKDLRTPELVELLKAISSERIGACVDTGNSIGLLEDPLETVTALAPYALTVHLKDMAVDECPTGFLLSEVPMGRGFLDLPRVVQVLRSCRSELHFGIEMITRDPLLVPCLTEKYWATLADIPGSTLAKALARVREHREGRPLPKITGLSEEARLKLEDDNVRECLSFARAHLNTAR